MHYVYVIMTPQGRRYIGSSENPAKRLEQHNAGMSKWTKRYAGQWSLVWQRAFETTSDARKFESLLKRQKGGVGFYKLTGLVKPGS